MECRIPALSISQGFILSNVGLLGTDWYTCTLSLILKHQEQKIIIMKLWRNILQHFIYKINKDCQISEYCVPLLYPSMEVL